MISAANSDALEDVLATLRGSGLGFKVVFHPARVQGEHLQSSMVAALRWFYRNAEQVDVVCIVRGGGSRSDLAQFDALSIARGVCHQRVPVLIGIGHKTDTCVLDDIAHSFPTPTAVGAALVGQVRAYLEAVQQTARRLALATRRRTEHAQTHGELAQRRLALATRRVTRSADHSLTALTHALGHAAAGHVRRTQTIVGARAFRLAAATGGHLRAEEGRLSGSDGRLRRASQSALRQTVAQLEIQTARQRAIDPARILARGFAIVRGPDGIITSPQEAGAGTHLRIQLHRGTLRATSQGDQNE